MTGERVYKASRCLRGSHLKCSGESVRPVFGGRMFEFKGRGFGK